MLKKQILNALKSKPKSNEAKTSTINDKAKMKNEDENIIIVKTQ